ncbi:hypothetical protein T492DRAFT_1087353 [Pavlovales sp. CCMP2436]|nr:hypothetical protein T492DRAFT_1087353 [Pavlovales sp. CCMP2436]
MMAAARFNGRARGRWTPMLLAMALLTGAAHELASVVTRVGEPTHDEVKSSGYWKQLARQTATEQEALAHIQRGLAADRRHLYAWHWLLKLVLRHVRDTGGEWPGHMLPEPSHWAESDNGSFWHLRAVVLAEQLRRAQPEPQRLQLLHTELSVVWTGHWRQGSSEARWTYHRHLLELVGAQLASLESERANLHEFVVAFPEHAGLARFTLEALRPGEQAAMPAMAAWRELVDACQECDPCRSGTYRDLRASTARQALHETERQ